MKRLVYSPKAYVYVKTENNGLVNLSDYVVRGNVSRKVGMVSDASVEIRNPDMIWTRGVRSGNPVFRPMDPITIWLQRIANHPVQVFTGYLDQTPYLQLYPGVTSLTASCTLKRLLHTYWDPALPYVMNEFLAKHGWVNYGDGSIKNIPAQETGGDSDTNLTDGSLGNLLYAVLMEVGGWDPAHIHIENLPDKLFEKVANIYSAYNEDSKIIRAELENMLKKYIGEGPLGEGGGGGSPDLRGGGNEEKAFNYLVDRGLSDEQAAGVVGNLMHESGVNPKQHQIGGPAYGIAQWEGGRLTELKSRKNYDTLAVQLDFLWHEFKTSNAGAFKSLRATKTVRDACFVFMNEFERPAVRSIEGSRLNNAQKAFDTFSGKRSQDLRNPDQRTN